jgi:hypothetical protein
MTSKYRHGGRVTIGPAGDDGYHHLGGWDLLSALHAIPSVTRSRDGGNGVDVHTDFLEEALAALRSRGYLIVDQAAARSTISRLMPLPLPECPDCNQPYPRGYQPADDEHCISCGRLLHLTQHDPNDPNCSCATCVHPIDCRCNRCKTPEQRRCAHCGTAINPNRQRFCRCGIAVPQPARDRPPIIRIPDNDDGEPTRIGDLIAPLDDDDALNPF